MLDAIRDAIANASKRTKNNLVAALQMAEEWITSGTCTSHSVDDEGEQSDHVEGRGKKKRSRAAKKKKT